MPIVWSFPDGHLELTTLTEDYLEANLTPQATKQETVLKLAQVIADKAPHLKAAVPTLVASKNVPNDRSKRATWTLVDGVIVES